MFYGYVLSESLKDPTVLNRFNKIKVTIEKHKESGQKIWHSFKIKVSDRKIKNAARVFSVQIKNSWYAHFWNNKKVYVIFSNRVFTIPHEIKWKSKEYQKCRDMP